MKSEDLLSLAIPLIYLLLLAFESRVAARSFETVPNWRRTGLLFFLLVLLVGSVTPMLLPWSRPGFTPLMSLRELGYWGGAGRTAGEQFRKLLAASRRTSL